MTARTAIGHVPELTCDVAVIGGGLGGLATAMGLAKHGWDVKVYGEHTRSISIDRKILDRNQKCLHCPCLCHSLPNHFWRGLNAWL
jgi:heterodisulfide reductase subunit A-like polyferredoxin